MSIGFIYIGGLVIDRIYRNALEELEISKRFKNFVRSIFVIFNYVDYRRAKYEK